MVRLKVVHGVQQPRFVGMKEVRQRPAERVKAQADAEQQQKKQKRAFHRNRITELTQKKSALRQAQGERRAKRHHHRPFVVSLSNHVV